jgi:putative ABC transport system permease protein
MFARGAARGREIALRTSLGAGRGRIVRQLLTESCLLGITGGSLGALAAWTTLDALVAAVPLTLPATARPAIDLRVLGFALLLSLAASALFGLLPALRLSRTNPGAALAAGGRTAAPLSRVLGGGLIAVEIALTLVLVSGAALMIRSLALLYGVDKGFDAKRVVAIEAAPIRNDDATYVRYYATVMDRLRAMPGVAAVGAADNFPLGQSRSMTMATVRGQQRGVTVTQAVPGFFEAMGMPLRAGRLIAAGDGADAAPVVVVNESAARAFFGTANPLGQQMRIGGAAADIVGVVADVRSKELSSPPEPEVYRPYAQRSAARSFEGRPVGRRLAIVVRATGDPRTIVKTLREQAQGTGEPAIVQRVRTLDEWIDLSARVTTQRTTLLTLLGALGVLLAVIGTFGMTSYAVSQRTREIGVRIALGAAPRDVLRAVGGGTGAAIVTGLAAGLAATLWLTRTIASFLYEVKPADPISIAAAALLLTVAAALAAYLPARRALRVDPVDALRVE